MESRLSGIRWGAIWYSKNKLDGITKHILYGNDHKPLMFLTKKDAAKYIKEKYGYIAKRKDLRQEPFGWRMPKIIKLRFLVLERWV